ncbi:MAG: hypothetical protein WED07_00600 [Candidatus Freyarchaeum deiterrae]
MTSKQEIRMLQVTINEVEKTDEKKRDEKGNLFGLRIYSFSLLYAAKFFSKMGVKER